MQAPAVPDAPQPGPYDALFASIRAGRTDLLKARYDTDTGTDTRVNRELHERKNNNGQNLLMVAFEAKNLPAVDMILNRSHRTSRKGSDNQGNNIFHYAYAAGAEFVALLQEEARANSLTKKLNNAGLLPADVVGTQTPFIAQKNTPVTQETAVLPAEVVQTAEGADISTVTPPVLPVAQTHGLDFSMA